MKKVILLDENTIDFNSTDEVGISIITLAEATKGKSVHERHALFKKFIRCLNKDNYHIYIPAELNKLKELLNKAVEEENTKKQYSVLEEMCYKIYSLVCLYFVQSICLIVISLIHVNHNFTIINGEITYETNQERIIAEYCNNVVRVFQEIDTNKNKAFEDSYISWRKGDADSFGNNFFNLLISKYYDLLDKTIDKSIVLCGNGKNIKKVLFDSNASVSKERILSIFDAYFYFRFNDNLTKRLFIPYIFDAINDEKLNFEFNHIADSFLIFNALTAKKTENVEIELKSDDVNLIKVYKLLKQQI